MMRNLVLVLALISMGVTTQVHALGLGEASVTSSLNEPLRAEIELVSVKGLGVEEILPGLATREEFLKAGVDRVYFLSDLRFEVEKNQNGKAVIVLTTNRPVREPFLNFLVEVIWPSGRLLREYALLIDPPLFTEDPVAPVSAAPVSAPAAQEPSSAPSSAPSVQTGDRVNVAVAPVTQSLAGSYGPTKRSDTLWDIAVKARPNRSVSPQQTMLAIQDLNPGAFIDGNINKLKAGQVLRLPELDDIQARSASGAINEVIAQNESALGKRTKSITSAAKPQTTTAPKPQTTVARGDELKLVVSDRRDEEASSSANSSDSAVAGSGRGVENELAVTLEKLDKSNLEKDELSGKVKDLEEQLETLQRLLTLKNDQLATMQAQARQNELAEAQASAEEGQSASDNAVAEAGVSVNQGDASLEVATTDAETMQDAMAAKGMEGQVPDAADQVDAAKPDLAEAGMSEESMSEKEIAAASTPAQTEQAPVAEQPAPVEQEAGLEKLFSLIFNNPLYQALVGAGLLVLLLILWLVSRNNAKHEERALETVREASDEEPFDDVAPVDAFADGDAQEALDSDEPEDVFEQEAESELEAADASSVSAAEAEEDSSEESTDVIAEADVYIAYGRLGQAAAVLEQGISAEPVRSDYRLKLLEVYGESGDMAAFDRQYSELEAIQDQDAIEQAQALKASLSSNQSESNDDFEAPSFESEAALATEESALELDDPELDGAELDNSFDFDSVELGDDTPAETLSETFSENLSDELSDEMSEELSTELSDEFSSELSLDDDLMSDSSLDEALESVNESQDDDLDDLGIDLSSDDLELDLDIDLDDSAVAEAGVEAESSELDVELDLAVENDASDTAEELSVAEADELSDLELSDELEAESEIDIPEDLSIPDEMLDIEADAELESQLELPEDLEVADDALDAPETASGEDVPNADALALDDLDPVVSDEILEEAEQALGETAEIESDDLAEDDDFDFLNGTDEASTKLDLARAYIDMGDAEGAKDILLEVEKEGSSEQQAEARSLIDSLDA